MNKNSLNLLKKRENETQTVLFMIQIYCNGIHTSKGKRKYSNELCSECKKLAEYVKERVVRCPFMETKTFCSFCRVHCYKSDMREKIRAVMRYAGPRMLRYHPLLALKHVFLTIQAKKANKEKK